MKGWKDPEKGRGRLSTSFATGAIALVFLIIGYQTAVFIRHAAVMKVLADRDRPDTVFVAVAPEGAGAGGGSGARSGSGEIAASRSDVRSGVRSGAVVARKNADHHPAVVKERQLHTPRSCESFPFDPNTASVEDLVRLGFSLKQAQSIDNYRKKGGRFRRKSDFAKSYVVADSVCRRLEPYINIPKIDLNRADSAAFTTLPGVGKWFASRMADYRRRLGGYSFKEQLMEIPRFDREKFDGLEDLVTVNPADVRPYPLWTLPEDSLKLHPYIGEYSAHGIVIFRENTPRSSWSIDALEKAGVLTPENAGRLSRCPIRNP